MNIQMGQPKGSPFLQSALFIRASPFFWGGVGLGVGNWGCKRLPGWSLGQHQYYQHLHEVVVRHKSDLLCLLLVNGKGLTDSPTPEYVRQEHDDGDDDFITLPLSLSEKPCNKYQISARYCSKKIRWEYFPSFSFSWLGFHQLHDSIPM